MMENLSKSASVTLLKNNYSGHLAFIAQGVPFTLPITYYYDKSSNAIISYSSKGHKIDAMREKGSVSLQVEEIESNSNWQSVLVLGTFEELHGSDAKYYLNPIYRGCEKYYCTKRA